MSKRPIDKSKSSNIKCEHCRFWNYNDDDGSYVDTKCSCLNSPKHGVSTKYWNRCKGFEWAE